MQTARWKYGMSVGLLVVSLRWTSTMETSRKPPLRQVLLPLRFPVSYTIISSFNQSVQDFWKIFQSLFRKAEDMHSGIEGHQGRNECQTDPRGVIGGVIICGLASMLMCCIILLYIFSFLNHINLPLTVILQCCCTDILYAYDRSWGAYNPQDA